MSSIILLYDALRARGFLIDCFKEGLYASENMHADDFWYLNELLDRIGVGKVEGLQSSNIGEFRYSDCRLKPHVVFL